MSNEQEHCPSCDSTSLATLTCSDTWHLGIAPDKSASDEFMRGVNAGMDATRAGVVASLAKLVEGIDVPPDVLTRSTHGHWGTAALSVANDIGTLIIPPEIHFDGQYDLKPHPSAEKCNEPYPLTKPNPAGRPGVTCHERPGHYGRPHKWGSYVWFDDVVKVSSDDDGVAVLDGVISQLASAKNTLLMLDANTGSQGRFNAEHREIAEVIEHVTHRRNDLLGRMHDHPQGDD